MSFTTVPTVITGQTYTAADYNTFVKDNLNTLWAYTVAGDLVYASSATVLARLAIGSTGQYLGVTAGLPAWKSDGVPGIFQAAGDLVYATGSAASDRLAKPSKSAVLSMNTSGVPSWRTLVYCLEIPVVAEGTDVDTTSGIAYTYVPSQMDGMVLTRAIGFVVTAGTTNPTTIQVRNMTKYASNDALSVAISIASGDTVGTAGTVDTAYDDVSTNDQIKIYVTANSTTKAKGLWVILEYSAP